MRKTLVSLVGATMVLASCGLLSLVLVDGVAWILFGSDPRGRMLPLVLAVGVVAAGLGWGGVRLGSPERRTSGHFSH
jgi:hypothetical protein